MASPEYNPAANDLFSTFSHGLGQLGPFGAAPHIAVALSGGADSMALTLLAQRWCAAQGGTLTALTVDHGLRTESAAEALQVAQWMGAHGIPHRILTPPHAAVSNNSSEAARIRRYDALAAWCRDHGVLHCLLAHHRDDQAETIALATARGDTADGPAGMSALKQHGGVRFLRPVLQLPKSALVAWLRAEQQQWVEDPTNRDPRFARARLRTAPLAPPTADAAQARMAREAALAEAAMRCVTLHPAGYAWLAQEAWSNLAPILRTQLLADLLTCIGGNAHRPRRHETERLDQALRTHPAPRHTLHRCLITAQEKYWLIAREPARVEGPVQLSGHGTMLWDGRFRLQYQLPANLSLTLRVLGADGKTQLRAADNASVRSTPLATPSIWHLDELRMVPHIMRAPALPEAWLSVGFTPPKPLAAQAFWWLN